jgi:hypothetical protein
MYASIHVYQHACIHIVTHKVITYYMYALTGYAPPVDRSEPMTEQEQREHDERWFKLVNRECKCKGNTKCGDWLREILVDIRADGALTTPQSIKKLQAKLDHVYRKWKVTSNSHNSSKAAACNYSMMPRALLPRVRSYTTHTPHAFPFVPEAAVDDTRAMRYIRSSRDNLRTGWRCLQARLQQYTSTGKGSIAEAIVVNDCWWSGQIAYEAPSGNKSQAVKRRHAINSSAQHDSKDTADDDDT